MQDLIIVVLLSTDAERLVVSLFGIFYLHSNLAWTPKLDPFIEGEFKHLFVLGLDFVVPWYGSSELFLE